MRTILPRLLAMLIISLSTVGALAQQSNTPPIDLPSRGGDLANRDWYRDMVSSAGTSQTHHSEPRVLKKGPLAPSDEDRAIYAGFLAQPHTGLIRLLSRQFNQPPKNADGTVIKINGGGAYYSFAFLTHEYGFGSDLELSTTAKFMGRSRPDDSESDLDRSTTSSAVTRLPASHEFSVGFAGADYGMMTTVDDVAMEDITSADPRVRYLLNYLARRTEPAARREALAFRQGKLVDLQLYRSRLPIQLNTTYLLRSICYRESDVVVAFRVVRQEPDGSVTIAWKLLKQFPTPELARN